MQYPFIHPSVMHHVPCIRRASSLLSPIHSYLSISREATLLSPPRAVFAPAVPVHSHQIALPLPLHLCYGATIVIVELEPKHSSVILHVVSVAQTHPHDDAPHGLLIQYPSLCHVGEGHSMLHRDAIQHCQ